MHGYFWRIPLPVALMLLELAREPAGQPEAVVVGAWGALTWMAQMGRPAEMAKGLFEAGCLDAALAIVQPLGHQNNAPGHRAALLSR